MRQIDELLKRSYVMSYALECVSVLQYTCERECPMDCNWIDEDDHTFVFRADKTTPNFKSWAAYYKYPLIPYLHVIRAVVNERYYMDVTQYYLSVEDEDRVFYQFGDPFYEVLVSWKDEFDTCLNELLLK